MSIPVLKFKRLNHSEGLPLPTMATPGSAGLDVAAAVHEDLYILPNRVEMIPTGFCVEIPEGYELQVRGRSSLGKVGLVVAQGVGTIDSDYRGEIFVPIFNRGDYGKTIKRGQRVAQLIFSTLPKFQVEEVDELSETSRAAGGFGSTGL